MISEHYHPSPDTTESERTEMLAAFCREVLITDLSWEEMHLDLQRLIHLGLVSYADQVLCLTKRGVQYLKEQEL